MPEEFIEFPTKSRQRYLQLICSAIIFAKLVILINIAAAIAAVIILNLILLAGPATASINTKNRTLKYLYRKPYTFRRQREIDLSKYSRIYSQAESYAGRSLHLSGPKGEHLMLAKYHQNLISANQHIQEIGELRKRLASALKIHDGGDVL